MTVGLPCSGKSDWAELTGLPIVATHAIRAALHGKGYEQAAEPMVWAITGYMVRALMYAGHDTVILCSTAILPIHRAEGSCPNEWDLCLAVFETTQDECLKRALEAGEVDIIPHIERMATQIVYPQMGTADPPHYRLPDEMMRYPQGVKTWLATGCTLVGADEWRGERPENHIG